MNDASPPAAEVRAQLDSLLASPQFKNAPSLARFLRFVVERSLEGDTAALKESVIGIEVFDRGPNFDPKADSIVRMQAANLRTRLAKYYEAAGAADAVRIEIPKGAYVPVFAALSREPAPEPERRRPHWLVIAALALVVALAGIALAFVRGNAGPPSQIGSVAVLPFADFSAAHDLEYFCDGMSEEIIDSLAKIPGLRVVARTSAFAFKGKSEDVRLIGQKLGVAAVMEGSIQKQGDRLRITVQLNRASDGSHLWSDYYDRPAADLLQVETEISHAVAARVMSRATPAAPRPIMDAEAHRL